MLWHHERGSFALEGGTAFTFVTDGMESVLRQALAAAKGERLFVGLAGIEDRHECVEFRPSKVATHLKLIKIG